MIVLHVPNRKGLERGNISDLLRLIYQMFLQGNKSLLFYEMCK